MSDVKLLPEITVTGEGERILLSFGRGRSVQVISPEQAQGLRDDLSCLLEDAAVEVPATRALTPKQEAAEAMYEALKFAKEVIDDLAQRFHQECRCQLCESLPVKIDAAIKLADGAA